MHTTTASHILLAQAPSTCFTPLCIKSLRSMAFAGCLSLAFLTHATAADFSGSLKGVSITDAQATNKPPTATFTYTQKGEIITLDASGSSDPDGNITKYKWTFSDGKVTEGVITNYSLVGGSPFQVTLTVIDNNSGVALSHQTVTPATQGILDDFSTDTTANYTVLSGKALSVYNGALHTETWSTTIALHKTSLGSNDHTIEANVSYAPEYGGGLLVRCDPTQQTGYLVYFESGRVSLNTYNNGTLRTIAFYDGKYIADTYRLSVTITGNTISASVNNAVVLTKSDSTFANGAHAGVRLRTGVNATAITVDNLVGK